MAREVNAAGIDLIKRWEGLVDGDPRTPGLDPYLCSAGYWTIGWGHVVGHPETGAMLRGPAMRDLAFSVYPQGITEAEAEEMLAGDLARFGEGVSRLVEVEISDNQFAALVSWAFNIGLGRPAQGREKGTGMAGSTLLRRLNAGDHDAPIAELPKWNKAGGTTSRGLTARRADEAALWSTPDGG